MSSQVTPNSAALGSWHHLQSRTAAAARLFARHDNRVPHTQPLDRAGGSAGRVPGAFPDTPPGLNRSLGTIEPSRFVPKRWREREISTASALRGKCNGGGVLGCPRTQEAADGAADEQQTQTGDGGNVGEGGSPNMKIELYNNSPSFRIRLVVPRVACR